MMKATTLRQQRAMFGAEAGSAQRQMRALLARP
jgi:hypothetical protein